MDFDKSRARNLSGRTKKEITRDELVSQVKAERLARNEQRVRSKAASLIQRHFWGFRARRLVRQALFTQWLQDFASAAALASTTLPAPAMQDKVLPPILFACLPPASCRQVMASSAGSAVGLNHATEAAPIRGMLALLLRSIAAADPGLNFCSLATDPSRRQTWQRQSRTLVLLCAGLLGSAKKGIRDALLELAAARVLVLLLDSNSWTCYPKGDVDAAGAAEELRNFTGSTPVLATAVRRLAQYRHNSDRSAGPWCATGRPGQSSISAASDAAISPWPGEGLVWSDYMWALVNLTQLVSGVLVTKKLEGGRSVQYLPKSALLGDPGNVVAYLHTALGLLSKALSTHQKRPSSGSGSAAQGAVAGLWPLAEGTFVTQLLSGLKPDQLPLLAHLYHLLLASLPVLAPATGCRADKEEARLVNALAMGSSVLPRLWPWLATSLGLPLEAPMEATRGWDIASLQLGLGGVDPAHAAVFGLFCRVYAQALLVLDDDDFYQLQSVFNLGQQRGIATSLNTLVYSTHCPATVAKSLAAPQPAPPYPGFEAVTARAMLGRWAPHLLREMYERDVRQRYCPAALWLGPFLAAEAAAFNSAEERFSAAAVMRALLQGPPGSPSQPAQIREPAMSGRSAALAALLTEAPQCVPFNQRVLIFRSLVTADKERGKWEAPPASGGSRPVEITVRRGTILDDGFAALHNAGSTIKGRLAVSFVNVHGQLEAGLDHGGLVKEFLEEVVKAGFDVNRGLFTSTAEGGLAFPQPSAAHVAAAPALLHFLGLAFGKALYEGILLDTPLAPFFVARLQGRRPMFDELAALDPELHRNLLHLKRYAGEAEDLGLSFAVEEEAFGRRTEHELIPGGADVAVTNANKLLYVHLVADWHLNGRLGDAAAAFAAGLAQVIAPRWLRLFNPAEVNQLLAGGEGGGLDVADMRAHAKYSGGYAPDSPTVRLFWKVVEEMGMKERSALMKFATSVSRAPLGGFKHLNPPLTLHRVPCDASPLAILGGADVDRLPTASTCYNMLKLPNYRRASTLRKKLLYAISANAGFDLS
ncbi:hypothetical protein WJX75_002686 [Coccomyxa subellipsoidea]|uniref:HECT-type E3 ubiquitin transferase n=1 Tax=Coccomyxa subellipsoidea TaxID=248742 RepID=A0ABR2YDL5_9CHLO